MNPNAQGQPGAGGQDYVDKGVAALEKKRGMNVNQGTNEKITDAARGVFEKVTGKPVSSKVSN